MSHTRFTVLALFAIIAALSVTPVNAAIDTVNITHSSTYYSSATLNSPALGGSSGGGFYTGVYSWTINSATGLGTAVPTWGFCIELPQASSDGTEDVIALSNAPQPPQYGTPMGGTRANAISELWGRNFDSTWATGGNTQTAQAFSFAIWEIIYETDPTWNVISGAGFSTPDSTAAELANTWLGQLTGNSAYFAAGLVAISSETGQDYVVQIPEPATLSLLAIGAAALLRRRKS